MDQTWVLLHGAPLTPAAWDGVRTFLPVPAIAPNLNRWIVDAPARTLQHDLAVSVLATLPDGGLTIVGHSLGGQVAMEMAMLAPHRVRDLVLVCTRDSPVAEFSLEADRLRAGGTVDSDAGVRRWFTPAEIAEEGPTVRYARAQLESAAPLDYATALEALALYDRRARLGKITARCVLLCGRRDRGCTPSVMTQLATDLPDSRLLIVDEWAHMSPFVHPAAFAHRLATASTDLR